jgi:hypothetical protein
MASIDKSSSFLPRLKFIPRMFNIFQFKGIFLKVKLQIMSYKKRKNKKLPGRCRDRAARESSWKRAFLPAFYLIIMSFLI